MSEATVALTIAQGADFQKRHWLKDKKRVPINLVGFVAVMQIRDKTTDALVLELTTQNGRITLTDLGLIQLDIEQAEVDAMTFKNAVYALRLISPSNKPTALMGGRVYLTPSVIQGA